MAQCFLSRTLNTKLSHKASGVFYLNISSAAPGIRSAHKMTEKAVAYSLEFPSGPLMKMMRLAVLQSRPSKSTPDGTVKRPATKSVADFRWQLRIAVLAFIWHGKSF